MIIETRIWDTKNKKMIYLPPLRALYNATTGEVVGATVLKLVDGFPYMPKGEYQPTNDPIMVKSPIIDKDNNFLWEGDVIECGIVTELGLIKANNAVLVWRPDKGGFIVEMSQSTMGATGDFKVTDMKRVGNIFENPELKEVSKKEDAKE